MRISKRLGFVALIVALSSVSHSFVNAQWRKAPGPVVGPLTIVKTDAGGKAFAVSGPKAIFVSSSTRTPEWKYLDFGGVESIASDGSGQWVMASSDGSIWYSANDGKSFSRKYGTTFTDFVFTRDHSALGIYTGGVKRFDGADWNAIGSGIRGTTQVIARHPSGDLIVGTSGHGLFRSKDDALTWDSCGLGAYSIKALGVDSNGAVYASTMDRHLFLSVDRGQTWSLRETGFAVSRYYIMAICGGRNGTAFALQYSSPGGTSLYVTTNTAASWSRAIGHFDGDTNINAIALSAGGDLIAATNDRIFVSSDKGVTWAAANTGLMDTRVSCFAFDGAGGALAGTDDGIFRSTNQGDTWNLCSPSNTDRTYSVHVDPSNGTIVSMGYLGVHHSTDFGHTWFLSNPKGDLSYHNLWRGVVSTPSHTILAGSDSIYRSTNGGYSWKGVLGGVQFDARLFALTRSGKLYCASQSNSRTYYSTNDGLSWQEDSLIRYSVPESILSGYPGEVILGSTWGGSGTTIFRSTDDGGTWQTYTDHSHYHYYIQEDSTGALYSCDSGVHRSLNHGETWEDLSDGFGADIARIEAIGAGPMETLFAAGVSPEGSRYALYKRGASHASVAGKPSSARAELLEVWPNPSHDKTSIRFSLAEPYSVQVTVYDLLGVEQRRNNLGDLQSGEHSCSLSLEGISSGSYLICLRAGDNGCLKPLIIYR